MQVYRGVMDRPEPHSRDSYREVVRNVETAANTPMIKVYFSPLKALNSKQRIASAKKIASEGLKTVCEAPY